VIWDPVNGVSGRVPITTYASEPGNVKKSAHVCPDRCLHVQLGRGLKAFVWVLLQFLEGVHPAPTLEEPPRPDWCLG
jgi:hypothetical protein